MAFTTGTATSYYDMLDKLRQWLTGTAGWTQLAWAPGANPLTTDSSTLSLRGPGSGSGREVYINIKATPVPASGFYSWAVTGAVGYSSSAAWGSQPGEGPPAFFNTWQNSIAYWFYANDRRVIVIAKCSTVYVSMYAGYILPWANPDQYPFPLLVAADYSAPAVYNAVNSSRRMFCDPGASSTALSAAWCRDPSGTWNAVMNQRDSNSNDYSWGYARGDAYFISPFVSANDTYADIFSWAYTTSNGVSTVNGVYDQLAPTAQGERLIIPAHLNATQRPSLGALDGVYASLAGNLVAEQTVSAGGLTLRAFQNIARNSANDIFLINEI